MSVAHVNLLAKDGTDRVTIPYPRSSLAPHPSRGVGAGLCVAIDDEGVCLSLCCSFFISSDGTRTGKTCSSSRSRKSDLGQASL